MSLYESLGVDPTDLAEAQCGMLNCIGAALADTTHWLKIEVTATNTETGKRAQSTMPGEGLPVCPPHMLVWEVFFDTVPDDVLPTLLALLVDLKRYPLDTKLVEAADAAGDEETP